MEMASGFRKALQPSKHSGESSLSLLREEGKRMGEDGGKDRGREIEGKVKNKSGKMRDETVGEE